MAKGDPDNPRVSFSTADRLTMLGIGVTVILTLWLGGMAVYRDHDRDITTLKADNQTLKAMVAELQADAKVVRSDVAEMKALLLRQAAAWPSNPTKDERMASIVHLSKDMGVGQ